MKNSLCNNKRFLVGLYSFSLIMFLSPTSKSMLNQIGNENIVDFIHGVFGGISIASLLLIVRINKNK